jgi:chromosome segregation ATPase
MIPTTLPSKRPGTGLAAFLALAACLGLAGCATSEMKEASTEIAISDAMLTNAIRADAPRAAPEEVVAARTEIDMAKRAYDDYDFEMATLIAKEAQADASLAENKARTAAAQAAVNALQENMRVLRSEMNQPQ